MGKTLDENLTDMQAAFVRYYLISLNAKQAAIKAGYSESSAGEQGHQLLQHPSIKKEIARRQKARAKRLEISGDNVLRELARIGFADIRRVATVDAQGMTVTPTDEIDDDDAAAIQEVSENRSITDGGVNVKLKVKLHDKIRALDLIGRHIGLWKDGIDLGQPIAIRMSYDPNSTKGKTDGRDQEEGDEAGPGASRSETEGPEK